MKLKTFFISYILFLSILLAAISTISIYLTNHHMASIKEQRIVEYDRFIVTIEREINALYERDQIHLIESLLESHRAFQQRRNVRFYLNFVDGSDMTPSQLSQDLGLRTISFDPIEYQGGATRYELSISGSLLSSNGVVETTMTFDVTDSILELRQIQRVLLNLFIIFSLVAATMLHALLNKIFEPLELVARSAEKISKGDYSERIQIQATGELALMADNFNQMGKEIENHITYLKGESERKQQFIDNLAHELRTPLTSIYGYAEYMQKAKLTEEDKLESTTFILEEADYMRRITNSMLELAKLRNYKPVLENINIGELFIQIEASLAVIFNAYQVEFVIMACDGYMTGQGDLIKSLVSNLCINAAIACKPGQRVELKGKKEGLKMEISVVDYGCGIEDENIAKLTEPFYQVDKSRNRSRGGVGLGLAIVKQIAQIHGAEIEIKSEIGVGTEVKVIF